jgi:hypothetical protein
MIKLKIIARILPKEDYLWHTYNSSEPMDITIINGKKTIHMEKGMKFGIRPSTSGSAIRMITELLGPTIVFTLSMDQKRQLLHHSNAFDKAPKKASQFYVDLPSKVDIDTLTVKLDWKLTGNSMVAEIDPDTMEKIESECFSLPLGPKQYIKNEILNYAENPDNIDVTVTWNKFKSEPAYVEVSLQESSYKDYYREIRND